MGLHPHLHKGERFRNHPGLRTGLPSVQGVPHNQGREQSEEQTVSSVGLRKHCGAQGALWGSGSPSHCYVIGGFENVKPDKKTQEYNTWNQVKDTETW